MIRIADVLADFAFAQNGYAKGRVALAPENNKSMKGGFLGISGGTNKETIVDFVRAKFEYGFP
ncbi:MAG TPA: hypothetical protein VLC08_07570 [Chitinolyticbacter sp.]|nr:hypothetical protein [Chitinolyticbacter sp.]